MQEFVRGRIARERDQELGAKIFAPVFIKAYQVAILFYVAHDGVFHIVIAVGDALPRIGKDLGLAFGEIVEIALFQSGCVFGVNNLTMNPSRPILC